MQCVYQPPWGPRKSQRKTAQAADVSAAQSKESAVQATDMLIGGLSVANKAALKNYGTLGIILEWENAISCAHVMVHAPPSDGQVVVEPAGGNSPQDDMGKVKFYCHESGKGDVALVPVQKGPC